jgi:hypothetical protein
MVPDAFDENPLGLLLFLQLAKRFKEPLKRRLTVYFADDKVARYENQGVPRRRISYQLERDLRRAIAVTKNKKAGLLGSHFRTQETPPLKRPPLLRLLQRPRKLPILCRLPRLRPAPADTFGSALRGRRSRSGRRRAALQRDHYSSPKTPTSAFHERQSRRRARALLQRLGYRRASGSATTHSHCRSASHMPTVQRFSS